MKQALILHYSVVQSTLYVVNILILHSAEHYPPLLNDLPNQNLNVLQNTHQQGKQNSECIFIEMHTIKDLV